jgi:hypothetical protein
MGRFSEYGSLIDEAAQPSTAPAPRFSGEPVPQDEPTRAPKFSGEPVEEQKTNSDDDASVSARDYLSSLDQGFNTAGADLGELVRRVPLVGDKLKQAGDALDRSFFGQSPDEALKNASKEFSPSYQESREKSWWDSKEKWFGPAWTDPNSYISGMLESLPEEAMTIAPAMKLAKGAFTIALAKTGSETLAANAAARTAMIVGGASEGALAGAQSSRQVRDDINALPDDTLRQSDAVKSLMDQGMSFEDARKEVADNAATKAFFLAGATTGIFSGLGDRALAKIIMGNAGGVAKRIIKGAVAEGVLEEFPQSYLQQVSQNFAMRDVKPDQDLFDDALNQGLAGLALGAVQGGAMGGAFGHHTETTANKEPLPASSVLGEQQSQPALPAPSMPMGQPTTDYEAQRRSDAADAHAAEVYAARDAEEQRRSESPFTPVDQLSDEQAARQREHEARGGIKSLLADTEAIFGEITKRPAILDTIEKAARALPVEQQQDVRSAIDELVANPKAIWKMATERPQVLNTITQATEQAQRLYQPEQVLGADPRDAADGLLHYMSRKGSGPTKIAAQAEIARREAVRSAGLSENDKTLAQKMFGRKELTEDERRRAIEMGLGRQRVNGTWELTPQAKELRAQLREERTQQAIAQKGQPSDQALIDRVNKAGGYDFQAAGVPGTADASAGQAIAKSFGKRIVWFSSERPIHGASYGGNLYVNVNSSRPHLTVIGHELLHSLRESNEDIYQGLLKRLVPVMKGVGEYRNWLAQQLAIEGKEMSPEELDNTSHEELVADFLGDHMTKPEFWREVFKSQPKSFVEQMLAHLRAAIESIRTRLQQGQALGYGTEQFIGNAEAVRKALADAYNAWAKEATISNEATDGSIRQSRAGSPGERGVQSHVGEGGRGAPGEGLAGNERAGAGSARARGPGAEGRSPLDVARALAPHYNPQFKVPESSLAKQGAIGKTYEAAAAASPAYQKAVFAAYEKSMPVVLEGDSYSQIDSYKKLIQRSYESLAKEVKREYDEIAKDITIEYHSGEHQYASSDAMRDDVLKNKHLWVYEGGERHEFLGDTDPTTGRTYNEMFRAIHDYFGHVVTGAQFGPKGEEQAWASHVQMMPKLARIAMTSETRGQNSFVNYSPINIEVLERVRKLRRDEAPQKAIDAEFAKFQYAKQASVALPPEMLDPRYAGGMPAYMRAAIEPTNPIEAKLVHYSPKGNLTETDPSFYGTGLRGEEADRVAGGALKRTYFYLEGQTAEYGVGANRYEAQGTKLYDLSKDPENLRVLAAHYHMATPWSVNQKEATSAMERLIYDRGYDGYTSPTFGAAAVFEKLPVTKAPGELKLSREREDAAARAAIDKIINDPKFQEELKEQAYLKDFLKNLTANVEAKAAYGKLLAKFHNWKWDVGTTLLSKTTGKTYKIADRSFSPPRDKFSTMVPTYLVRGSDGSRQFLSEARMEEGNAFVPLTGEEPKLSRERDVTQTPEFKRWFGDSKVVDAEGKPLVVYHGTPRGGFSEFDENTLGTTTDGGYYGPGFYFTSQPGEAGFYAQKMGGARASIYPAFLSLKNPFVVNFRTHTDGSDTITRAKALGIDIGFSGFFKNGPAAREIMEKAGYDGVLALRSDRENTEAVAFRPEQIKSAIGNRGTFDEKSPNIMLSRDRSLDTGIKLTRAEMGASLDQFVYGDQVPPQFNTIRQAAEFIEDRAKTLNGDKDRSEFNDKNVEAVAKIMAHEGLLAAKQSGSSIGWYRKNLERALATAALLHPEIGTDKNARFAFTYALAVTSNGTTVRENSRYSFEAYRKYVDNDGKMPFYGKGTRGPAMAQAFTAFNRMLKEFGSIDELREFMLSKHDGITLKKAFPKIRELTSEEVYGGTVIGSKIGGGFLQNLNGNYDALTIDRWFMRTWGRMTAHLTTRAGLKSDTGIIDAPSAPSVRAYIRRTAERALEHMRENGKRAEMSDLQALLWYPEKDFYHMMGVADENSNPTSYHEEITKYVQSKGIDTAAAGERVLPSERGRGGNSGDELAGREAPGRVVQEEARPEEVVDQAAHEAATSPKNELPEPTPAQKEAGNYQKGHVRIAGLDISIENPAGSERTFTKPNGEEGSRTMQSHYGYVRGTVSGDGEHMDIFIKPGTLPDYAGPMFVIDQRKPGNGAFDEHKVVMGWPTMTEAKAAYQENYQRNWDGITSISRFENPAAFKSWLESGNTEKPAAEELKLSRDRDGRPGERFEMRLELARQQNGDWMSPDSRYEVVREPDGYYAKVDGSEIGWGRDFQRAKSFLTARFNQEVEAGTIKNPNDAKSVINRYTADQQHAVVDVWKKIAALPSAFRFTQTDAKDAKQIAKDIGADRVMTRVYTDPADMKAAPEGIIYVDFIDGNEAAIHFDNVDGTAQVAAQEMTQGGFGAQLYQLALAWAHNNKYVLVPDTSLTYVNTFRRTEQMISAALRYGTTKYMRPHLDQGLYGWINKPQTKTDEEHNLALMLLSSYENVMGAEADKRSKIIDTLRDLRYNFTSQKFETADGKVFTNQDWRQLAERDHKSGDTGNGVTTLQRAVLTQSVLDESRKRNGKGLAALVQAAPGNAILDGDHPLRGVLYSRQRDTGSGQVAQPAGAPKGGAVLRAALSTARAATAAVRPVTAALDLANRGADLLLKVPGKLLIAPVTSRLYDRVVGLGQWLAKNSTLAQEAAHGLIADYGLPEPYLDARQERESRIQSVLRSSKEMIDRIASLDRAQARVAYTWMQEKPDTDTEKRLLAQLPPESRQALAGMKEQIDQLGQEAVKLGLLSKESFDRNRMAYLHRTYKKHELENPGRAAAGTRAKSIRADAYRGRGLRDDVAASRLPGVQQGDKYLRLEDRAPGTDGGLGALQRVVYLPAGKPVPQTYSGWRQDGVWEARFMEKQGQVGMWRDLTPEERQRLGEIDEVRYAFARTMLATTRDIETARFLKWTFDNYAKTESEVEELGGTIAEAVDSLVTLKVYADNEWVKVPTSYAQGTKIPKYGALAGAHVPGHIWNDMRSTINLKADSAVGRLYDQLLRGWKMSKTALSPAVHTNNVMSNFVLADMADVHFEHIRKALSAIIDSQRGNAAAKTLMERYNSSGAEGSSHAAVELRTEIIEPMLKELEQEHDETLRKTGIMQAIALGLRGNLRQSLAALHASKAAQVATAPFKIMVEAYREEDTIFRLAKFIRETEAGKSDKVAGREARKSILDYNINAPWVQALRRGPLPFLSFSYRAIPILLDTAAHKPWKMMKYFAVGYALNALAYAMLGGSGDEDKERKLMPEEKSGRSLGVFYRMLRMPWNDENGAPVFMDIRRWIPGGDIVDLNGSQGAIPLPSWLSVGGPISLGIEMAANKDMFTGKTIVKDSDEYGEKMVKIMDHIAKFIMPNVPIPNPAGYVADEMFGERGLFQTYSWKSVLGAGTGETDAFGRERNLAQSAASAAGVKIGSQPEDVAKSNLRAKTASAQREISENISALRRERHRVEENPDAQENVDARIARQREKSRAIQRKYSDKIGLEPNP